MSLNSPALRVVLYEGMGAKPLDPATRSATLRSLLERGFSVTTSRADSRPVAPADRSPMLVIGQFEGMVAPQAEDSSGNVALEFADITGRSSEQLPGLVENARARL